MSKGRVIIVDDDKEFLEELRELLELSGHEVFGTAQSGLVQEQADKIKPDVILLDLKMRDMNGFEVAQELRYFTATMGIPIIAMTGFFQEKEHIPLLNICGIQKCLKKPFNPLDVISAIEGVVQKN